MEYPADDLTAARSLQIFMYLYMSIVTFWTYDYICSLHEEWTFLLRSRWTKVKALYITVRYAPFLIATVSLYVAMAPTDNINECQMLMDIITSLSLISLTCSECFFVLRTYVLWNKNRIILVTMLSTLFAVIVSIFIIGFTATATSYRLCFHLHSLLFAHIHSAFTATSNVIPGCRRNTDSFSFSIPFILLSVFQLVLVSLTLVCVIQSWRSAKGPLYAILVKHNIFYYTCGLLLSTVNVLAPVLLVLPLSDFLSYFLPEAFEVFILAILATRMHLHLWRMDQQVDDPDIVVWISMSDMSPADHMV